jgi:hypothetical protein
MPYSVTHEVFGANEKASQAVGIDPGLSLSDALDQARQLLIERKDNVTIRGDDGNSISGDDLVACCNGTKTLSSDLRAI